MSAAPFRAAGDLASPAGDAAAALASLPRSFRTDGDDAPLTAVDGGRGWPAGLARAVASGARGIVLLDPLPDEVDTGVEQSVPVIVDTGWNHDPAVAAAARLLGALGSDSLVATWLVVPTGAEPERTLLGHLALVRAAVEPVETLRLIRLDRTGYDALGVLGSGARVALSAVATTALPPVATLRVVGEHESVELTLHDPSTAAPGTVVHTTEAGSTTLPTIWETSHRVAWRSLRDAVADGRRTTALTGLAADAALLRSALGA